MLAPKLRFKEFNDEWKKIKLKKLLKFKNGINASKESYGHGVKYISVRDILNNNYITYDNIKGLVDIDENTLNENAVHYGDIVFQRSSETFEDIGQANVYLDENKIATFGGFVIRGKKISDYDPIFFNYLLKSPLSRKSIIVKGAGAQHYNISQEELEKISLYFPNLYEQQKIGKFLSVLDKKIELQQRKIEVLKMYKKGLSDNIYASLKEKIIELNNYAIVQGGFAFKSELFQKKGKPIVRISNIYNNLVDLNDLVYYDSSLEIDKKFYVNDSDLLIAMSGATTGKYGIYHNTYPAYLNQRVGKIICKKDTILYYPYLYFLFGLTAYEKQLQSRLIAGAQPNISPADIETMKFKFPNINTQKKIADMIINITKKISIENKKLDNLNILKQSLLQQMFI